jgi:hypothetical protein
MAGKGAKARRAALLAGYIIHRKDYCERCGITKAASVQYDRDGWLIRRKINAPESLTVHHKDHNAANNDPTNLMTLCRRCHDLEHNM